MGDTALKDKIRRALNCLAAAPIADPHEIIENTRAILEGEDLDSMLLFVQSAEAELPDARMGHESMRTMVNAGYMDETLVDRDPGPGKRKRWHLSPAGEARLRELNENP